MKLLDFYKSQSTHVTISFEIVKSEPAKTNKKFNFLLDRELTTSLSNRPTNYKMHNISFLVNISTIYF